MPTPRNIYDLPLNQLPRTASDWRPLVAQCQLNGHLEAFVSGEPFTFKSYEWHAEHMPRRTFCAVDLNYLYEKGEPGKSNYAASASVWFNGQPVMIVQNVGEVWRRKFITNTQRYIELCFYIRTELLSAVPQPRSKLSDVVDLDKYCDVTSFMGHMIGYMDPRPESETGWSMIKPEEKA